MCLFKDLSGSNKNLALIHKRIAETYTRQVLCGNEEVLGAVLLGGAARGYADELSEIDLAIFLTKGGPKKLPRGEHRWRGHLFDNNLYLYRHEVRASWSQERKQAFLEGKILLDRLGLIRRLLRQKLQFTSVERRNIVLENLLFFEDRVYDAETLWPKRGHLPSAHYAVNMAIEHLLKILFAYNGWFLPGDKWRLYYSHYLPWLPKNYHRHMIRIMTAKGIESDDLKHRVAVLKQLDTLLRRRLQEENMLPRDLYRYCVEKIWTT